MPKPSLDEIFGSSSRPSLDEIFGQQSRPKPMFSSVEEANAAMQQANQAQQEAQFNASPMGFIKQHPFLAPLQGGPEFLTGQSLQNRLYQSAPKKEFTPEQAAAYKSKWGMLPGNMERLSTPDQFKVAGGALIDQATSPSNLLLNPVSKGLVKGGTAVSKLVKGSIKSVDDRILDTYSKAINPSISRVKNATTLNEFKTKTPQAMKAIANNADNIQFTDEATGVVENRLPKSRIEAFEALKQTKQSIFDKYNSLTKDAADKGATVNVYEAAKKSFDNITNSRQFSLYEPKLQQEASSILKRIEKTGKGISSPEEVEKDIQFLNQKMQGYYKKGDYNASNIYASYAGNLREALDNSIEKALNQKGYQQLKNEYSSLKFVEKDLAQAAARQLKQVDPKLGDGITDPLAIMEMARGILTSNPSSFASGLVLKSVVNLRKYLNNPDLKIKLMFEQIKKSKK